MNKVFCRALGEECTADKCVVGILNAGALGCPSDGGRYGVALRAIVLGGDAYGLA
jgi:hypothetical protein